MPFSIKEAWDYLSKILAPLFDSRTVAAAFVLALIVFLAGWIAVGTFGPIFIQAPSQGRDFTLITDYPNSGVMHIPPAHPNRLQVLSQRTVVSIDRWVLSYNPEVDCPQWKGLCDESHIFQSWTVLSSPNKSLKMRRAVDTFGTEGKIEYLSGHRGNGTRTPPDSPYETIEIESKKSLGDTDLILTRRSITGTFQPTDKSNFHVPNADSCRNGAMMFSIFNPTANAEFFIVTSKDTPEFDTNQASLALQLAVDGGELVPSSPTILGRVEIDEHMMRWEAKPEFLRDLAANKREATVAIVWSWKEPLKGGKHCGPEAQRAARVGP